MGGRVRTCRRNRSTGGLWVTRGLAVLLGLTLVAGSVGIVDSAGALVPSITKDDFVDQANAVCEAGNAKLDAAGEKLGDSPTDKQIKAFVLTALVPNISGQIAAIRKLGFPAADKEQLTALFASAERILARIKKNPSLVTGSDDPFAAVNQELSAYGLTVCSNTDPVSIAEEYAGTYQGTWTNTTFGSTGTIKIDVVVDASAKTAKITTTLTGNVFGAPAPPPETLTIPLGDVQPGQPPTVTSPLFGQLSISVKDDGTVVGDAPNVPSAAVNTFHVELKPSATGFAGTYSVVLASGTTANGTLTLTRS